MFVLFTFPTLLKPQKEICGGVKSIQVDGTAATITFYDGEIKTIKNFDTMEVLRNGDD